MMRILHCADIHLASAERDYGLAVLGEVVGIARSLEAKIVLFAGDLFDSFADLSDAALRGDFVETIRPLEGRTVFAIPGNHDLLRAPEGTTPDAIARYDWGILTWIMQPYEVRKVAAVEFVFLPHGATDYGGFLRAEVPPKTAPRVLVAHGTAAGLVSAPSYEDPHALDPEIVSHFAADYAAFGHIHTRQVHRLADSLLAYPGSARVWRRGEAGPRGVFLVETKDLGPSYRPSFFPVAAAGEYREVVVPVDGPFDPTTAPDLAGWKASDFVFIRWEGFVEDEPAWKRAREAWANGVPVRKLEHEDLVEVVGDLTQPIVRDFLAGCERRRPAPSEEEFEKKLRIWRKARRFGLEKIIGGIRK